MAVAILAALLVVLLLVAGLVVVVSRAVRARRELEDLGDEFAETRGVPLDEESRLAPWSSFDLEGLRDDVTDVDGHDPFATLARANSPVSSDVASAANGSEPKPTTYAAPDADLEPDADLAPLSDPTPLASPATADAPVIVLVVGAGFLGTGTTPGVTTAARPRRSWGVVNDSFAQSGVVTLDADPEPAAEPSYDPGAARAHVAAADRPISARSRRRSGDPCQQPPAENDRITWSPASCGVEAKPPDGPKPIVWRAPAVGRRR
jgi:Putative Flp pilus-assembly TadE/G-like